MVSLRSKGARSCGIAIGLWLLLKRDEKLLEGVEHARLNLTYVLNRINLAAFFQHRPEGG